MGTGQQTEVKKMNQEELALEEKRLATERAKFEESQRQAEIMKQQGMNADGSPIRPEYQTLIDPATGMLKKEYLMETGMLDPTKLEGYTAFKNRALSKGPSEWANLMMSRLEQERVGEMDNAVARNASGQAGARSSLAMKGGLSSGARERIAKQGMRDLADSTQNVSKQASLNKLGVLTTDEETRNKFLMQLPGMETDVEKFNIGNQAKTKEYNIMQALQEKDRSRIQDLEVYKEQQKKWAAERQAQATEKSGGGGGGK